MILVRWESRAIPRALRQGDVVRAMDGVQRLDDFSETGTRELTAEDYVYQVKRLVHPHLHSPVAGFMAKYIVGLEELAAELRAGDSRPGDYLDLREVEIGESLVIERITGRKYLYKVVGIDVVDSRRGSLQLDTDASYLSLVTCYPFDQAAAGGPLRYVITAQRLF